MDKATKMSTTKARQEFSEVVSRVAYGKEHVVLSKHGKDLAAVIPMDLYQYLVEVLESARRARRIFEDPNTKWYDEEEGRRVFLEGAKVEELEGRGMPPSAEDKKAAEG